MNRTKEIRWIYAILFLSVSVLLIAIGSTFGRFNDTEDSFNNIEKTDSLIIRLAGFDSYIYRSEDSISLSIIEKDPGILKVDELRRNGKRRIKELRTLTPGYTELVIIDSIDNLLDNRFDLWKRIEGVMSDTAGGQYLTVSLEKNSSDITNRIEVLTKEIRRNERKLLQESIGRTRQGIMVISAVLTCATLLSIVFIFFSFNRLHKEIKREMLVQVKLQQKIQELDRSNTHLERFAYTASHDLQEPLRKLHAFSEKLVLQERENLSDDGKSIIDRMQKFVDRMQRLIDDLLLFSRTINYKLVKAPVDLNRVLSEVKQNMSENITGAGAIIHSGQLPVIMGYESQLQQLFQNLISNSIRYARKHIAPVIIIKASVVTGAGIPAVKTVDKDKKYNMIVFADNGIGFDNKYADRIFEIFQRLHGKSEYEGTGIGLSICKLVAENHDGYIRAEGVEGEGAAFMVYLPVI